ncbi:restriction endonuclease subunit S [Lactococcus lactis subsp. lactis]
MIFQTPKFGEQQKIGAFFKQLDYTIALHQRKLDKLKRLKKGYLQQLFSKNDDKVPRVRFANFTDEWELRKLGELASSFEYGLNASAKEFDGIHKYIRITDIDDSSRKFNSESLTSPDIALSSADNYKLKNGDILFARTGASVGKSYLYIESDGLVYYAGFLIRARIKSEFDSNFVFQHTLTSSYESFIRVTSQRSGQPGVNAKEYSIFEIGVPSLEEQQKIGLFFKRLDDTFTLHQSKLDKLNSLKQALLQKLFV